MNYLSTDESEPEKEDTVYTVPILLVVMSLALAALIYWGGFVEERRNRVS